MSSFQGLETVLASELIDLGANNIQIGRRMVSFTGNKETMYRANFQLRTAIRVLKPISHFKAKTADEVYDAVKQIDWTEYLSNDTTFAVDSVVFSNEFKHSKFVAYKVKDAIVDQFREKTGNRPNIRIVNPDIQLHIHVAEYDCTLALDSSGESLHRRGYRQEAVEAPLNEVLAAGIILQTGWRGECDLIDPMCGSGTILIEAAMSALNIPAGFYREKYGFFNWKNFDRRFWEKIVNEADIKDDVPINFYGSDISTRFIGMAKANVQEARLSDFVRLQRCAMSESAPKRTPAYLIFNPPYGERLDMEDIEDFYKQIGNSLKQKFAGCTAFLISSNMEAVKRIGLHPSKKTTLYNGALECKFLRYDLYAGSKAK